jgi:hypothetical protein
MDCLDLAQAEPKSQEILAAESLKQIQMSQTRKDGIGKENSWQHVTE